MADVAPLIAQPEPIPAGSGSYLAEALGKRLAIAEETITARLATPEEARELGQDEPAAVLVVRHTVIDADEEPIVYDVGIHLAGTEIHVTYEVS